MGKLEILDVLLSNMAVSIGRNIQTIESIATIAAICAGLWWFYKRREKAPRANVEHQVKFIDLKNGTVYVGVHVSIQNTGNVIIRPKVEQNPSSVVVVEELMPYLNKKLESQELSPEYKMGFLGSRTFPPKICIEPGEKQSILFEFVIQGSTKSIKVYSHIDNSYNGGIGWDATTIHEVRYERE